MGSVVQKRTMAWFVAGLVSVAAMAALGTRRWLGPKVICPKVAESSTAEVPAPGSPESRAVGVAIHDLREVDAGPGGFFLVVDEPYLDGPLNATVKVQSVQPTAFGWTARVAVAAEGDKDDTFISVREGSRIAVVVDGHVRRLIVEFVNSAGVVFRREPAEPGSP